MTEENEMLTERSRVLSTAVRSIRKREKPAAVRRLLRLSFSGLLFLPALARATDLESVDAAAKAAQSAGDNAWMLTSAALVLMMTGPGLALFYGGLVRKKNVLGTMMQSFILMAVVTVLWALLNFSLCFGEGTSFIGGFHHLFLRGV